MDGNDAGGPTPASTSDDAERDARQKIRAMAGVSGQIGRFLAHQSRNRSEKKLRELTMDMVDTKKAVGTVMEYLKTLDSKHVLVLEFKQAFSGYKNTLGKVKAVLRHLNPDMSSLDVILDVTKLNLDGTMVDTQNTELEWRFSLGKILYFGSSYDQS